MFHKNLVCRKSSTKAGNFYSRRTLTRKCKRGNEMGMGGGNYTKDSHLAQVEKKKEICKFCAEWLKLSRKRRSDCSLK